LLAHSKKIPICPLISRNGNVVHLCWSRQVHYTVYLEHWFYLRQYLTFGSPTWSNDSFIYHCYPRQKKFHLSFISRNGDVAHL
jgi:hypothetical protein